MKVQKLMPGDKVDIHIVQQVNSGEEQAKDVFISSIYDVLEDDSIEIYMPSQGGKVILLSNQIRYEFIFNHEAGLYKAQGAVVGRYKRGGVYICKIKLNSALEKFQRREYYRMDCSIPTIFMEISDEIFELKKMADIHEALRQSHGAALQKGMGTILDISGGGLRFSSNVSLEGVYNILLQFTLQERDEKKDVEVLGQLLSSTYKKDLEKYIHRVKFDFKDGHKQEEIIRYIFNVERRIRKKEQG